VRGAGAPAGLMTTYCDPHHGARRDIFAILAAQPQRSVA
jgi:hypothetical protein